MYVVCCNNACSESGIIKKKYKKCTNCKTALIKLSLNVINEYFCINGYNCKNNDCDKLHPYKQARSPTCIMPCLEGIYCTHTNCMCLHPRDGTWLPGFSNNTL